MMHRLTWRSLTWKVDRCKHVERYKRVRAKSKRLSKRYVSRKGKSTGARKRCIRRGACRNTHHVRRVRRTKPLYWTEYYATAQIESLCFHICRTSPSEPYTAYVSLDNGVNDLAQASGDSPAKAFNKALDNAEVQLKRLKTAAAKATEQLYVL